MNNTNYYNPIILSGDVVGKGYPKINNTIANGVIGVAKLSATGTPSSTTYLRGDNTWATISGGTGTVTSIGTSAPLTGGTITTSGTIGITQATTSTDGYLSSTDWTTFNNKFTLPSLTAGSVLFSNGTTIAQDNANLFWDDTNKRLYIGSTSPKTFKVNIYDASSASLNVQTTLHQGLLFASNGSSAIGFGSQTVTDFIIRTSGVERARIKANGAFGIGVTSATAVLHLKAGTASAGTAPLKLTSGTNLTTPEDGTFEFDGTNLYFTVGGVRKTVTLV